MPEKLLEQLLRLRVGRTKPPVENGSLILHPKITQHLQIVSHIVNPGIDNVFERGARTATNRASGISDSAKILNVERKFADGRLPSVSRSGVATKITVYAKLIVSGSGENSDVCRRKPASFLPF